MRPLKLPKYVSVFKDRHGQKRYRYRRTGYASEYLQGKPGTLEFRAQIAEIERHGPNKIVKGKTFDDLISRYYESARWRNIGTQSTMLSYFRLIEKFRANHGHRIVSETRASDLDRVLYKISHTPTVANRTRKLLINLFDFAIKLDWISTNPAVHADKFKVKVKGFHTWTEDEITKFDNFYQIGTQARLAKDLLLYTAQRRSDVIAMGPPMVRSGCIDFNQQKTLKRMVLPIHPKLAESIIATEIGAETFLVSSQGRAWTPNTFGNWFRARCDAAGLTLWTSHGGRKAAARRMAELGLSNQQIKSLTGHSKDSEVALYTRAANQSQMAIDVMRQLAEWEKGV